MNNASLELGGTNWAEKDGNILGYSVGDTSGNFSPQEFTFARGSNLSATRIDRAGLIVKGRENVLLQSNSFDTTWALANTSVTSGQSGYDGSNNAWLFQSTSTFCRISQNLSFTGIVTQSVYAKAGTSNFLFLEFLGTIAQTWFNLNTGSVATTNNNISSSIIDVGGGWYRCSMTYNQSAVGELRIRLSNSDNTTATTASSNIYIQDAQIEQGLAASPYIETTTTSAQAGVLENTPRLNYTTGVANPYLLLEPSRTNRLGYSELFSNWTITGSITISANQVVSPEGVINASIIDFSSTGAGGGVYVFGGVPSSSVSRTIYLKGAVGGETLDFSDPSQGGGSNITLTTEWQRFEYTGGSAALCGIWLKNSAGNIIYAYGAQIEEGSYPTSYIPTYSVSATRAQDNCSKTNASGEIGQTEGVLYAEVAALANDGTYRNIALSDGSLTNRILIQYTPNANQINIVIIFSGGQYSLNHTVSNVTEFNKIAIKYKAGDNALWINGFEVDTDTNTLLPSALNTLSFDNTIGDAFYSKTKALVLYKEALTDTQLATLTTI